MLKQCSVVKCRFGFFPAVSVQCSLSGHGRMAGQHRDFSNNSILHLLPLHHHQRESNNKGVAVSYVSPRKCGAKYFHQEWFSPSKNMYVQQRGVHISQRKKCRERKRFSAYPALPSRGVKKLPCQQANPSLITPCSRLTPINLPHPMMHLCQARHILLPAPLHVLWPGSVSLNIWTLSPWPMP